MVPNDRFVNTAVEANYRLTQIPLKYPSIGIGIGDANKDPPDSIWDPSNTP